MRVAWFLTNLRGGGAERLPLVLGPAMTRAAMQIVLLKDWVEHAVPEGMSPPLALSGRDVSLWASAGAVLREATRIAAASDVVVGGMEWAASIVAAVAAMRARKPFVAVVHPDLHAFRRHQHVPLAAWHGQRWAMRRAARVVAVSEGAARACRLMGVTDMRLRVVPNPHPGWATALADARPRAAAGAMHLLTVGSLHRVKGTDLVPTIAALAGDAIASWTIVGDGPQRDSLAVALRAQGLEGRVRRVGFEAEPAARFESADVYVLPSRAEGLPLSLLEAMASALPVVAARCGPSVESLLESEPPAGVLVPAEDATAMAGALRALAGDPAQRMALAAAARARVEPFAPAAVAAQYEAMFSEVSA